MLLILLIVLFFQACWSSPVLVQPLLRQEITTTTTKHDFVRLNSELGRAYFSKLLESPSSSSDYVLGLLQHLDTQINLGACAAASACTVLNTLDYKLPYDPSFTGFGESFPYWTQTAFSYDACVRKVLGTIM
jgi:hypothetical protein